MQGQRMLDEEFNAVPEDETLALVQQILEGKDELYSRAPETTLPPQEIKVRKRRVPRWRNWVLVMGTTALMAILGFGLWRLSIRSEADIDEYTASPPAQSQSGIEIAASSDTPGPVSNPYDLSILVTGEGDVPVVGAKIVLTGTILENDAHTTDAHGLASWSNLPQAEAHLSITAQGYLPLDESITMAQGSNQIPFVLALDPHGLLPSQACSTAENLLYVEDFQDGDAQGWMEVLWRTQGWDIQPHPNAPEAMVVFQSGTNNGQTFLRNFRAEDSAWRIRFMIYENASLVVGINFRGTPYEFMGEMINASGYQAIIHQDGVISFRGAGIDVELGGSDRVITPGEWHLLEFSAFEGRVEIWVDGYPCMMHQDPYPLPDGTLILEVWDQTDEDIVYIKDIAVCGLTEPFTPLNAMETD